MVTPRGAALLTGALLLWALGRLLGLAELYVLAGVTGALVVVGAAAVRLSTARVAARRTLSASRLLCGGEGEVVVELRNDARLPAALLLAEDTCPRSLSPGARFVVPGLAPGRTVALRYPVHGGARGRYTVGPLRVRVRDPFGVAQRVRRYRTTDEVVVYPRIEPLPGGATPGTHHGSGASETRRLFSAGDEFYTMREYVTGDDLRLVHWPSTARRQTLMVRQQEQPWQVEATVFCDTRSGAHRGFGPDSPLEKAVGVAASLVWYLADAGYALRLATETDVRGVELAPWQAHLDRLAELEPSRLASISPAVRRLRAGASGLLAAVVAPPPADDAPAGHPDVRALLFAGRTFSGRLALVVTRGADRRGEQTAALLRAGGWRAVTISPGQPLADRWQLLLGARLRRRVPAGT